MNTIEAPRVANAHEQPPMQSVGSGSSGSASGFRVRFENVGACKRSWETTLKRIDFGTLYREVKKRGGIMSRGVEFCTDDDARTGSIFVGVFRCVGTFTWQNTKMSHAEERSSVGDSVTGFVSIELFALLGMAHLGVLPSERPHEAEDADED